MFQWKWPPGSTGPVVGEQGVPGSKLGQDITTFNLSFSLRLLSFMLLFLPTLTEKHICELGLRYFTVSENKNKKQVCFL